MMSTLKWHAAAILALMLAGCGGTNVSPRLNPAFHQVGRPDLGVSWMTREPKEIIGDLLYVGDWYTDDVFVFQDFPLKPVLAGKLTGFDEPYGMCLGKKGDVLISNYANGTVEEFLHGGTKPINTYSTAGAAIGCSVSATGDVAVTDEFTGSNYGPGQVCIWKGGTGSSTCYGTIGTTCYKLLWTFGYDHKGNLIGNSSDGTDRGLPIAQCALIAGSSSLIELTSKNISLNYPGGTHWDGNYIALGDDLASYESNASVIGVQEARLSGTTLIGVGSEIKFPDTCFGDFSSDPNPFFVFRDGPTNRQRALGMIGPNFDCTEAGSPAIDWWAYPGGGFPKYRFETDQVGLYEPYGVAVSIKECCDTTEKR